MTGTTIDANYANYGYAQNLQQQQNYQNRNGQVYQTANSQGADEYVPADRSESSGGSKLLKFLGFLTVAGTGIYLWMRHKNKEAEKLTKNIVKKLTPNTKCVKNGFKDAGLKNVNGKMVYDNEALLPPGVKKGDLFSGTLVHEYENGEKLFTSHMDGSIVSSKRVTKDGKAYLEKSYYYNDANFNELLNVEKKQATSVNIKPKETVTAGTEKTTTEATNINPAVTDEVISEAA